MEEETKSSSRQYDDDEDEFLDALDEFPLCAANVESNGNPQSNSHPKSSKLTSSDNCFNSRGGKIREYQSKLQKSDILDIDEKNDNAGKDLVRGESNSRESHNTNSSLVFILAAIVIKSIRFQIHLFVSFFMLPIWSVYFLCMLVFNPFRLLKSCRDYSIWKIKRIWNFVLEIVSSFVYEWLKEHQAIWKLGLKCVWGLLWSAYVYAVLLGLLFLAFVMGGILIRVVVEGPVRIKRSFNFDYMEKSPVAFVPIMTLPEPCIKMHLGEKPEIDMASGSRFIPPNHKLKATISLKLPESDYNQNLGIFQIRVDFLAAGGKTLASSRHPCRLKFRSQPIRLLLTLLKVAPILTGYASETEDLEIKFRGFIEGDIPTACLRVVIEQRAQYLPAGTGIPEIYAASLTLESEPPLLKKVLWAWKKTLFVWTSMAIFIMEIIFALLCCKPFIIPRIKLREAQPGGR